MHILFLSDNFPPETNAPASRVYEHASHWVRLGHRVTVITCAPNFPQGKIFPGYRNRWYATEERNGIRVVRVKTYITANQGFLRRTLDYLSFMIAGFCAGLFQRNVDVILGTSPQFFTVVGAWLLAAIRGKPFVFELRDLWPASIATVGAMRDGTIVMRWLEKMELFLYRRATSIVTVTHAFKADLVKRNIPADKIAVVLNGVDADFYQPRPRDNELACRYQLENKFVVGYLGTHGMSHALDKVLATADLLRGHESIVFMFAGDGAERQALMEQATSQGLPNVRFIPPQPKEMMPRLWSLCDVALIHLKDKPVFGTVIPSKLFEAMGMGLPIILALPAGEASALVRQHGVGLVVMPEQPEQLAAAVLNLYQNPAQLRAFQQASRTAALQYSRRKQAEKMLAVCDTVIRKVRISHPS